MGHPVQYLEFGLKKKSKRFLKKLTSDETGYNLNAATKQERASLGISKQMHTADLCALCTRYLQ